MIAINQDAPFVAAASRIVGGDLTYPCNSAGPAAGLVADVTAVPCIAAAAPQLFYFNATDSTLRPAAGGPGGNVVCVALMF